MKGREVRGAKGGGVLLYLRAYAAVRAPMGSEVANVKAREVEERGEGSNWDTASTVKLLLEGVVVVVL